MILASPGPVVFLDTSCLLDIIRTGWHVRCHPRFIPAASGMIEMASESPPSLWVVAAEIVRNEWADNCEQIADDTQRRICELDQSIKVLAEVLNHLGLARLGELPNFPSYPIRSRLRGMAENLLGVAKVLGEDYGCSILASRRSIMGWAPASKGKDELKDCMIIEQYISLCRMLRETGFSPKCVFISSNVKDYGRGGRPLPPLDKNFEDVGIEYVTDLAWAMSIVRASY